MLFRTIYGPELESIYTFIALNGPQEKDNLFRYYLSPDQGESGKANLEDAIAFLVSSSMLKKHLGNLQVVDIHDGFKLQLLKNLRCLQKGTMKESHALDPWYFEILDKLFVKPDRVVLFQLHQHCNTCGAPEIISEEKINAWRRFMEFIGVGQRVFGGFYPLYSPELMMEIIKCWSEIEGPLQVFLEEQLDPYLPWQTAQGDIASVLANTLVYLEKKGIIHLSSRQDLPQRSFLGSRQVKWIKKECVN